MRHASWTLALSLSLFFFWLVILFLLGIGAGGDGYVVDAVCHSYFDDPPPRHPFSLNITVMFAYCRAFLGRPTPDC